MTTLEVYVVAEIATGVVALLQLMLLPQFVLDGKKIQFTVDGAVEVGVFADLFIFRLVAQIIGYTKILVIVAASFKVINFIGTDAEVQIQDFFGSHVGNNFFHRVYVCVNIFSGDLDHC